MTIWQAIVLGIVQGITEFLPVSSSGHLVLGQFLLGFTEPQLLFDVAVHFATLFAVVLFFLPVILKLRFKEWMVLVIGTIPAVVIGLLFKDVFERLFGSPMLVSGMLLGTAALNFWSDRKLQKAEPKDSKEVEHTIESVSHVSWKQGLLIGLFQAGAIMPGISRSGSTLAGGLWQRLDRQTAFTFSFLLSLPAVSGATLLQIKDVYEVGGLSLPISVLIAGGLAAFVTGYGSLWLFKKIVTTARLELFGWYCAIVGVLFLGITSFTFFT